MGQITGIQEGCFDYNTHGNSWLNGVVDPGFLGLQGPHNQAKYVSDGFAGKFDCQNPPWCLYCQ